MEYLVYCKDCAKNFTLNLLVSLILRTILRGKYDSIPIL